jgi:hypothetical protein
MKQNNSSNSNKPNVIDNFVCTTGSGRIIHVPNDYHPEIKYGYNDKGNTVITPELPVNHNLDCNDPIIKNYIDSVDYILTYQPFTKDNPQFNNTLEHNWIWDFVKLNNLVDLSNGSNITPFTDPIVKYSLPIMFLSAILYSIMDFLKIDIQNVFLGKSVNIFVSILILLLGYISIYIWYKQIHKLYPKYTTITYNAQKKQQTN